MSLYEVLDLLPEYLQLVAFIYAYYLKNELNKISHRNP